MRTENVAGTTVLRPSVTVTPRKETAPLADRPPLSTADAPTRPSAKPLAWLCLPPMRFLHCVRHPGNYVHPGGQPAPPRWAIPSHRHRDRDLDGHRLHFLRADHPRLPRRRRASYIVARDNLGELPAQAAGAALLTDYILTVAVSISSGVAQIVSAFPTLADYRVGIAVGLVAFVMLINLRGVKESGAGFCHSHLFLRRRDVHYRWVGLFRTGSTARWAWWSNPPEMVIERLGLTSLLSYSCTPFPAEHRP